jgi:hypothetical protein
MQQALRSVDLHLMAASLGVRRGQCQQNSGRQSAQDQATQHMLRHECDESEIRMAPNATNSEYS